ncbi:zinc finger protein 26-like [Cylas formicarius]|uniref:zinc finger protein 26-like n=1 Tax=Cylas formicarius TaxID=197179 RepID=UPI002958A4C6|nr:zinc finger protein 26-like [Cylas formicarius]
MDFGRWCRICSVEVKCGVFLFGEEAKRSFLHAKIRKYLSVSISLEDRLPKMICEGCILKLDGFHKFATMAIKNQERMTKFLLSSNDDTESTKSETKSLLHTYLTKGVIEKDVQNDTEITEMEVRVDPMAILQCCMDDDVDEEDEPADDEDDDEKCEEKEEEEDTQSEPESGSTQENLSESENCENTCIIYLCSICKRSFSTEFALQDHMYIHSSSYTRRILSFSLNELQNHITNNGNDKQQDNAQEKAENGKTDEQITEESNDIYSCPICAKSISTKGNLKVHLETHRPKGQYGCDICGRVFKTQCNLYRHKEYHQGIQFPCEVCGRVYPTNSTLRAHSITHSDLRPHKCPLCDKTFKRNQDLKFHINQHTGARPYQCPYCPKAFASSGNCFSHRKRMHPIEVERDRERAAKIMR